MAHNFHIPVMGLAFTIDTPLKVARYGIDSVISIGNDDLIEDMRLHYCRQYDLPFAPIPKSATDSRARRITAYLNIINELVRNQIKEVRTTSLLGNSELTKYLNLLPSASKWKRLYEEFLATENPQKRKRLERQIRTGIKAGSIDVNIMTKLNKVNHTPEGAELPPEFADALATFRGFANSELNSSVVFSAGFNPRLFGYIDQFEDFFPNEKGQLKKKIILKVSDYRSAMIQGKYLAKRGIWVSEYRIESGLNCGGHAFPTEGLLMGPILETFKEKRKEFQTDLFDRCRPIWQQRQGYAPEVPPPVRITVQGGIGTAAEQEFLQTHYGVESTGWGTPFLLVPEATTVDHDTLEKLIAAKSKDLFLSEASPLGVPFNNLRQSSSERQREARLAKGRPGSPCLKKHLVSNTEFTEEPICTASRKYQYFKLKELEQQNLEARAYEKARGSIVAKACLCEDLAGSAYEQYDMKGDLPPAPAICPGPNLAFFSGQFSLRQMVDHIYGRNSLINETTRPHMFVKELSMYVDFLEKEWKNFQHGLSDKKESYFRNFRKNLEEGMNYYIELNARIKDHFWNPEFNIFFKNLQGIG